MRLGVRPGFFFFVFVLSIDVVGGAGGWDGVDVASGNMLSSVGGEEVIGWKGKLKWSCPLLIGKEGARPKVFRLTRSLLWGVSTEGFSSLRVLRALAGANSGHVRATRTTRATQPPRYVNHLI